MQTGRAEFTPSVAPVQKKMWGPYYMNTPSDCLHQTRTVVIIGVISNIICSRSPTRTLFCDFCTVTPLVVLAVVSYLGHSKKILID